MEKDFNITLTEEEREMVFFSIITRAFELKDAKYDEEEIDMYCRLADKFNCLKVK